MESNKQGCAMALALGLTVYAFFNLFGIFELPCLGRSLILSVVLFALGLFMGRSWPKLSWIWGILLFLPYGSFLALGVFSNFFAGGWEFAWGIWRSCEGYSTVFVLCAACLGGLAGAWISPRLE